MEETRQQLWNMVRIVNILDDRLVELFMISDTSYIWQIIDQFVPLMQVRFVCSPSGAFFHDFTT